MCRVGKRLDRFSTRKCDCKHNFDKKVTICLLFSHANRVLASICKTVMIEVHIPSFRKVDDEHERSYTVSFCVAHLRRSAHNSIKSVCLCVRYDVVMGIG